MLPSPIWSGDQLDRFCDIARPNRRAQRAARVPGKHAQKARRHLRASPPSLLFGSYDRSDGRAIPRRCPAPWWRPGGVNKPSKAESQDFGGQHRGNITGGPIAASILLTRSWCRSYRAALAEKEPDDEREGDSNARQIRYSRWAVFLRRSCQCGASRPSHIVDRRVRASEG